MSPSKILINSLSLRLTEAIELSNIPGLLKGDVCFFPRGKVAATVGQRELTVHVQVVSSSYKELIRFETIQFKIDHNQRTREVPADRLDELLFDEDAVTETHEALVNLICNQEMPPYLTNDLYGTIGPFKHITTLLDPIPLYGRYFNTVDPLSTKIAGYKTYSTFISPRFYLFSNPLTC